LHTKKKPRDFLFFFFSFLLSFDDILIYILEFNRKVEIDGLKLDFFDELAILHLHCRQLLQHNFLKHSYFVVYFIFQYSHHTQTTLLYRFQHRTPTLNGLLVDAFLSIISNNIHCITTPSLSIHIYRHKKLL
jgi:hypothetical protein